MREEAIQTVPFSSSSFLLAIIVLLFSIVCVLPGGSKRSSISHIPVMEAFSSSAESYLVGQTFLSLSLFFFFFLKKIPADFSFFPSVFSPLETKCLAVYHFDSRVFIYICHPPSMGSSHFLACTSNPRPGSALFVVVVLFCIIFLPCIRTARPFNSTAAVYDAFSTRLSSLSPTPSSLQTFFDSYAPDTLA